MIITEGFTSVRLVERRNEISGSRLFSGNEIFCRNNKAKIITKNVSCEDFIFKDIQTVSLKFIG